MTKKDCFFRAHRNLVVKSIEELYFEDLLTPYISHENNKYKLKVSHVTYEFEARSGIWGDLYINKSTLMKYINEYREREFTANSFFLEIQDVIEISDVTLSQFQDELNRTIYNDVEQIQKYEYLDFEEFVNKDFYCIERTLPGHPKLILNKGRIGWGVTDLEMYSPERGHLFQLRWLSVDRSLIDTDDELNYQEVSKSICGLRAVSHQHVLVPVHPWQWDNNIKIQYFKEISQEKIVDLGISGDFFQAQASVRTLEGRNTQFDIKLSLSILNTSCVRGIPSKYIKASRRINLKLQEIVKSDSFLNGKLEILKEVSSLHVKNSDYENIENGLYRYKELFGVVFREKVDKYLGENESALPSAALFFSHDKKTFIYSLLKSHDLSLEEWILHYAENVILPLYHLQCIHGLGLVSHGQNIIVVLSKGLPKKVLIKDFHGDLRISTESRHRHDSSFEVLDKLIPEHLIHDLYTGHFVTTLRYFSKVLSTCELMSEQDFYSLISHVIFQYHQLHNVKVEKINLLRKDFEKILVNKVRFKSGYDESGVRLRPMLGKSIKNPLSLKLKREQYVV